jgi:hypothetical protein
MVTKGYSKNDTSKMKMVMITQSLLTVAESGSVTLPVLVSKPEPSHGQTNL